LTREFIQRFEEEESVELFVVEMTYGEQEFQVTDINNKNHLQLRTSVPMWHKENMINLGVKYLLPKDYKAFAWIDADVEFENNNWATDTLKILNGCKDVVQLFSHCVDMNRDNTDIQIVNGFGYSHMKRKEYVTRGLDFWHPGYAWAITRSAYEKIGEIYDKGVLGSGDSIQAQSYIGKCEKMNNIDYSDDYNRSMLEFQSKARNLRLGYTPGVIRHHFHGTKQNRKYTERWQILMNHKFSPILDVTYDDIGILIPTTHFSSEFKQDILSYFTERKEDE
jgi:hypothetical protein